MEDTLIKEFETLSVSKRNRANEQSTNANENNKSGFFHPSKNKNSGNAIPTKARKIRFSEIPTSIMELGQKAVDRYVAKRLMG